MPARRAFEFVQDRSPLVPEPAHVERVMPDYTWPQHMPLEQLRRAVVREIKEAAEMAAEAIPAWRAA